MEETRVRARVVPLRAGRARARVLTSVRPQTKAALEARALELDESLSGYCARVLAKHVGMEP